MLVLHWKSPYLLNDEKTRSYFLLLLLFHCVFMYNKARNMFLWSEIVWFFANLEISCVLKLLKKEHISVGATQLYHEWFTSLLSPTICQVTDLMTNHRKLSEERSPLQYWNKGEHHL